MNKLSRSAIRFSSHALWMAGVLLLAGCVFPLPKNIPLTGPTSGTAYPPAMTPYSTAYPAGPTQTGIPAPENTATVTVITATPGATSAPPAPTNTSAPAPATATATAAATTAPPPTSTTAPQPTATMSSSNTSSGSAPVGIALPAQRSPIQFAANTTSTVMTFDLGSGAVKAFQLAVTGGQRMYITIDGSAFLQVYDPNLNAATGVLSALNPVQIPFSQTGAYAIAIQGSGPVSLSVYIPAIGANQSIPAPIPSQFSAIQFQMGATSSSFSVNASAGTPLGYTIRVLAGQQMSVTTGGSATVTLLAPDGVTLAPSFSAPTHQWIFPLNQTGAYRLIVLGNGAVSLTVSIPAVGAVPTLTPAPGGVTRISFPAGHTSFRLFVNLVSGGNAQSYVLRINAGQTLFVETTTLVDVSITGPDGAVITSGHARFPTRWSAAAAQTGDYTFTVTGSGTCRLTFYVPPG